MQAMRTSIWKHAVRVQGPRRTRAAKGDPSQFDNPGKLVRRRRESREKRHEYGGARRGVRGANGGFLTSMLVADVLQNQHSTGYTNFTSFNPAEQMAMAHRAGAMWQVDKVQELVSTTPVVVYSKSWCPFCMQVKGLFEKLGVQAEVVEMDGLTEEVELMDALVELTGQRTVPNVFIGGQHVGGCDDAMQLHSEGKLEGMLKEAGALSA